MTIAVQAFKETCNTLNQFGSAVNEVYLLSHTFDYQCHYNLLEKSNKFDPGNLKWLETWRREQKTSQELTFPGSSRISEEESIYYGTIKYQGEPVYILILKHLEYNNPIIMQIVQLLSEQISYKLVNQPNVESLFLQSKYQKQITEHLEEGYLTMDKKGTITFLNQRGSEILGIKSEQIIGKYYADGLANFQPSPLETLKSGKMWVNREFFIERPEGKLHLMLSVIPMFDEYHVPIGLVLTFKEITIVLKKAGNLVNIHPVFQFEDLIFKSVTMQKLVKVAKEAAKTESNILIEGDSGTGKELIAQAIHNHSRRKGKPFVVIDCSSIPRDLVETELFGYVDGAFTGAKKGGMLGKFEVANGGTVFLDEIGEMPIDIQVKLLRVIQTRSITRVGGHDPIPSNIRIIAATNRTLEEEVKNGNFRLDLFYRLNVIHLIVPPLHEREGDIPLLARTLLEIAAKRSNRKSPSISQAVMNVFEEYIWPGNIREMENVLERALLMAHDQIDLVHLPNHLLQEALAENSKQMNRNILKEDITDGQAVESLSSFEKKLIISTLKSVNGNKSLAAKKLGISRSNLYDKLIKYEIGR
ncbi:sigma-54 interaction domain-containing protein [Neobacillus sp. Marseille-QA0830]